MSTQATVLIDSTATATLSATAVIPVLDGAVTGTGGAVAAQVPLGDLSSILDDGSLALTGGFGCNGATAQASADAGAALAAFADGTHGLDSEAHMTALFNLVVAMRDALVANGIMSEP